jgi:hypothetical protein
MKWKVVIVGPTGVAVDSSAFRLLYSFPTKEEAESHAESFRIVMNVALCDERGNLIQSIPLK